MALTIIDIYSWVSLSLIHTHMHTHIYTFTHTHWLSMLALSNVQPNNLSKVPFLYSVGEVRKRVCKAFGAEQDFLSTSVLDDICDQRDIHAVRMLPLYFRTGCGPKVWVPFCGCLETLAAQVSTYFHGFKGDGASQRSSRLCRGGRRSLCVLKQVSHQEIMVEPWVINDAFVLFVLLMAQGKKKKFISCLSKYCDISFSTGKFSITTFCSNFDTRFNNCKTLQCLIKTYVWPLFFSCTSHKIKHTQTLTKHSQTLTKICYYFLHSFL